MPVTQEQIAAAEKAGMINVEALARACDQHNFRFYLACAIMAGESSWPKRSDPNSPWAPPGNKTINGGANVYGHDDGGIFDIDGMKVVTPENVVEFWRQVAPKPAGAGKQSNGVGPMQITYRGFLVEIIKRAGGKVEALADPAVTIAYGVEQIAKNYRSFRNKGRGVLSSFESAANIYNTGRDIAGFHYGEDAVDRAGVWKKIVGTADLGEPTPPPVVVPPPVVTEPPVIILGDPITEMIKSLTLKHSKTPAADYVTYQGEHILPLDLEIILRCAAHVSWGPIKLVQGGLSDGTLSALTHAWFGGGDLRTWDHELEKVWELAACLLRSGIVPFVRGVDKDLDNFDQHLHFASREAGDLAHRQLRDQIREYQAGGDGLRGDKRYNGPGVALGTWKSSPYNPANISADVGMYEVVTTTDPLLGRDVDRKIILRLQKGTVIQASKRVKRWDRENIVTSDETYFAAEFLRVVKPLPEGAPA